MLCIVMRKGPESGMMYMYILDRVRQLRIYCIFTIFLKLAVEPQQVFPRISMLLLFQLLDLQPGYHLPWRKLLSTMYSRCTRAVMICLGASLARVSATVRCHCRTPCIACQHRGQFMRSGR